MDVVKAIHVGTAALSASGFFARGLLMLRGSPLLARRSVKTVPHLVDAVLLGSAVLLAVRIEQYPLTDAWLSAKVAALIAYIGLGLVALRLGKTRGQRTAAWVAALVVFAYIVTVAVTRDPLGNL